jgi:hypothetical protein
MRPSSTLFEERHFSWPEQPGNPKREANLPWFWFTDVGEAQTYLTLWWLWQGLTFLGLMNLFFVHNLVAGLILWSSVIVSQVLFMRVWVPLCRRADPNLSKWNWFAAGWFNPRSRHCLLLAWNLVEESKARSGPKR